MTIFFLYGNKLAIPLAEWLEQQGHTLYRIDKEIRSVKDFGIVPDLIVSFTYRYIISNTVIDEVNGNVVNLHISFLPWNKGADPNMWSWINDTPKGVSLHYVTEKIDAGDIIIQSITQMENSETLESSYLKLMDDAISLFKRAFAAYRYWDVMRTQPCIDGTYHRVEDLNFIRNNIDFNMDVKEFVSAFKRNH